MVSKSSELKNLSSRDIPTRRKAVRWLMENDIQESLPQFVKFIDDDDVWFREKAKLAFLNWCSDNYLDLVNDLLSEKSGKYDYFISAVLFNFTKNIDEIVEKLIKSENPQVRLNSRKFQLSNAGINNLKTLIFDTLNDSDYRVRIIGANFIDSVEISGDLIEKILADSHSKVKLAALNRLNLNNHSKWIDKFQDVPDFKIRFNLILLRLEFLFECQEYSLLVETFSESDVSDKRKLVSNIINFDLKLINDFITHLMDKKEWEFLILIISKSSKKDLILLRYELSMNEEVPVEFRLKLIDKLKSRLNLIDFRKLIENLEESTDMRLVQEGELIRGLLHESFEE